MKTLLLKIGILILSITVVSASAWAQDVPSGRSARAELRFLEGMSDHHQMALDMANDCLAKATTESVRTLCQNIIDAQTPEIQTMREWLLEWYNVDYTTASMMPLGDAMGHDMAGMDHGEHGGMEMTPMIDAPMMMGMMAGLNRLQGVDYEIAWVESMIDHHDDALHMAQRLLDRVPESEGHPELRALAEQIITDQTTEIELMETLLVELNG